MKILISYARHRGISKYNTAHLSEETKKRTHFEAMNHIGFTVTAFKTHKNNIFRQNSI